MAYQIPEAPAQPARLIAAYDSPRRSLKERGITLRAAPDLSGFRRYLAARQRAEDMAAAETALSAGLKVKRRGGGLRGKPVEVVDPQLRPVSWAVALRGDRRDIEDAWDHRGRPAHAYVLNSPSDSPAVCGYRPPTRRVAGGGRVAELAPASLQTNERCTNCLVLLYEPALRGEEQASAWPSADLEPSTSEGSLPAQSAEAALADIAVGAVADGAGTEEQAATAEPAVEEAYDGEEEHEALVAAEAAADYGAADDYDQPLELEAADDYDQPLELSGVTQTDDEYVSAGDGSLGMLEGEAAEDAAAESQADEDGVGIVGQLEQPTEQSTEQPTEAEHVVIPIVDDWDGERIQFETASDAIDVQVEDLGESALSIVGEPADALTSLLEHGAEDVLVVATAGQTGLIVGGLGRGADWAGTVLDMEHEAVLGDVLGSDQVLYRDGPDVQRIFGPFWARHAVLVPVTQSVCVVFGAADALDVSEQALFDAARHAAQRFQRPSLEDALADEREVAIALRRMMDAPDTSLEGALEHVLNTTAAVLGCSIAAGVARMGHQLAMRAIDLDGAGHLDPGQLLGSGPLLNGEQRISIEESLVSAGQHMPAVVSRLRLPLQSDNLRGLLVLTHTAHRARGFTSQDHRLAEAMAPAAVLVLERAAFGEGMRTLEDHIRSAPSTDPLTGLPNQAAWEAALNTEADRLARSGGSAAVAAFRIAGLRRLDERQGPFARDAALRQAAALLRRVSRSTDLAARVGEDEFRVLVRDGGRLGARKLATRVRRAAREAQSADSSAPALTISFANARSRPQLLAASRLVGQRLRSKTRSERSQVGGSRAG